ncbi:hypothetical protein HOL34_02680 [bacterium]|nr:hypothetical protein [bacterium]MBT4577629.1 hypothetical protein [bacterium]MBT5346070.1 hypothetical protein [bacterium]MBT6528982.1 hypothetical protein [bacterium]
MKKIIYALCISTITASIMATDKPKEQPTFLTKMAHRIAESKKLSQNYPILFGTTTAYNAPVQTVLYFASCRCIGKKPLSYKVAVLLTKNDRQLFLRSQQQNGNCRCTSKNYSYILRALKNMYNSERKTKAPIKKKTLKLSTDGLAQ